MFKLSKWFPNLDEDEIKRAKSAIIVIFLCLFIFLAVGILGAGLGGFETVLIIELVVGAIAGIIVAGAILVDTFRL